MKKLTLTILISLTIYCTALVAFGAPVANVMRSIVPEADNTYYIGTTTPSNLRYNGVFNNLTISGLCTGCGSPATWELVNGVLQPTTTVAIRINTTATSTIPSLTSSSTLIEKNALGVTQNLIYGLRLENNTPATSGNQQISPALYFAGRGWNSGGAGSSQIMRMWLDMLPVQGASGATSKLQLSQSRNGAGTSTPFTIDSAGQTVITNPNGVNAVTGLEISSVFSNSTPDTTQHIKLSNTGTNSWITSYFSGVQKGALGFDSSGNFKLYGSAGDFRFFNGIGSPSLLVEIYSGGIYNVGGSFNGGRLTAGSANVSPPSTFTNYGSTALQTTKITTNTTLDASYSQVIVDASTNNVCEGTPSVTTCSTYTGSGQGTCESHLPCTWNAGSDCSIYSNEYGMGTCSGTSGCSASTSSCSVSNNTDQYTCETTDDSWGGSCSWDTTTCLAFASTSSCNGQTGCTASVTGDCTALSDGGGDGTNCATQPECSYDSGTGACSGSYFTSCSGNLCGGDYYTGVCTGSYGVACEGTATCSGYGSSGACTGEAGCTWSTGVTITLPSNPTARTYWITKTKTSGTLTVNAGSGDTVDGGSSISTSATTGKSWMLSYHATDANWYIMGERKQTPLSISEGGTNSSSYTSGHVMFYDGTSITGDPDLKFLTDTLTFTKGIAASTLGIGTTTPFARLAVHSLANVPYLNTIFAVASSTNSATSTLFNVNATGNVGVSSSTPFGMFSINPIAGISSNQFVVGSSTATNFIINNSGRVGIGTTTPFSRFSIENKAGELSLFSVGSSTRTLFNILPTGNVGIGSTTPFSRLSINPLAGDISAFAVGSSTRTLFNIFASGFIGVGTSSPHSTLSTTGSYSIDYLATTTALTLNSTQHLINFTAGTVTVTLPTAVGIQGREYIIKNSGTGIITLNTTSSQTIDGNASGVLTLVQWDNITVVSDGGNWIITN